MPPLPYTQTMEGSSDFYLSTMKEVHAYLVQCQKISQNWFAFSTDEDSETLKSSAINNGQSMLATFLTVLYVIEGLKTEMLQQDLMQ